MSQQPEADSRRPVQLRIPEEWIARLQAIRPATPLGTFGAEAFLVYLEIEEAKNAGWRNGQSSNGASADHG